MQTRSARFWAITFLSGLRNTASASSRAPAPSTPMGCATFRPWYRAAAAAITIRRHGCGRTAALSVRPAAARITRTARAPTASISAHCCWTMPKRMPLHRRQSRMPFRAWCGALPGWGQSPPRQLRLRSGNAVWQKVARGSAGVGPRSPQAAGYL